MVLALVLFGSSVEVQCDFTHALEEFKEGAKADRHE